MMKKIIIISSIIIASLLGFCSINEARMDKEETLIIPNPIVTVYLKNGQSFKMMLYPEEAPNTVNNFIDLVRQKFYDEMPISKIIPGYLIQTGDPIGNGTGFPGYFIKSECKQNGVKNKLKCEVGTVCMARAKSYNTEGSQFFILLQRDKNVEGHYTAFGKVIEGLEVIENIGKEPVSTKNVPLEPIKIESMTVDTFGVAYKEPQVLSTDQEHKQKMEK